MKRFLLLTLPLLAASIQLAEESDPSSAVGDIQDSFTKGQASLTSMQDFIYSVEFNLYSVGAAKTTMQSVKSMSQYLNYFAAAGFGASQANSYPTTAVSDVMTYLWGHMVWTDAYMNNFNNVVSVTTNCSKNFNTTYYKIQKSFAMLANYSTNSTNDQKNAFIKECSDGSCETALKMILSSISGDFKIFECDLAELIYQGQPSAKFYKGHRDIAINMASGILNYALLGLTVHSAYQTLNSNNLTIWNGVQDQYGQQLRQAFDRINLLDQFLLSNQIANAQYNLNFLSFNKTAPQTNAQMNAQAVSLLQTVFPTKTWFVGTYNGKSNAFFSYLHCQDCLSLVDYQNRYNVFAVGVDPTVTANVKLLLSSDWQTMLTQYNMNAFNQAYNLGQTYCFKAFLSLVGEHSLAYSFPSTDYFKVIVNGGNTVVAIATNEACVNGAAQSIIQDAQENDEVAAFFLN